MPVQAPKRLFTAGEFHQMADARIFRDDDRLELLVGEIVEMTPIGRRHAGCVNYLNRVFSEAFGSAVIVSVQNPLRGNLMECLKCKGRLVKGTAPFSVDRSGYHLHWDAVPAWVCTQCGEPLFEGYEVDVIQEATKALDRENEKLLAAR